MTKSTEKISAKQKLGYAAGALLALAGSFQAGRLAAEAEENRTPIVGKALPTQEEQVKVSAAGALEQRILATDFMDIFNGTIYQSVEEGDIITERRITTPLIMPKDKGLQNIPFNARNYRYFTLHQNRDGMPVVTEVPFEENMLFELDVYPELPDIIQGTVKPELLSQYGGQQVQPIELGYTLDNILGEDTNITSTRKGGVINVGTESVTVTKI